MIKFPYGISDFKKIISNKYFYIDRTDRIPLIEDGGSQLLFLRPRRFGKSLLLSMLESYYDVAQADQFDALFGHLAIGRNPTSLHNQYFVLKWDFSMVKAQGETTVIQETLNQYVNQQVLECADDYRDLLPDKVHIEPANAFISFQSLLQSVRKTPYLLYLFIDEYDNFANEILMAGKVTNQERYKSLLYGEGALKALFKVVKGAATDKGLDRVFMTGVSPVVLSDITSGYNIAENTSLQRQFNDLCGFRESEIEVALCQIAAECSYSNDEVIKALTMMRTSYNGYCFTYGKESPVYNPTLSLYFMKSFQRDCEYPENMLDSNLAMDRGKISYISHLPYGDNLIVQVLSEAKEPVTISVLSDRFGVEDILSERKDDTFMASLLYYFGILTMGGKNPFGETILKIPNLVIRKLYVQQIQEMMLPEFQDQKEARLAAKALYQKGTIQELCNFIETRYLKAFDNRDYRWANELTIKTAFLTLLFEDTLYIMDSETALERGYADLTMIVRPDMRQFKLLDILIEFKYVSLSELGLTGEKAKKESVESLKAIPHVKQQLLDAESSLARYREVLSKKYDNTLRLRCFSVVALGFERLVWEEHNRDTEAGL